MSNKTLRVTLRWIHIIGSALIGTFVYSPLRSDSGFTALMQLVVIPVLLLTGIGMWQQPRLAKFIKHAKRDEQSLLV
jgi:cytochrome oxidase assembly protein ShyY1